MEHDFPHTHFGRVRRRLLGIGTAAGIVWGLAAATVLLLAGAWLDLLWEFSPEWRIVHALGGRVMRRVAALAFWSPRPFAPPETPPIARRLDRAGSPAAESSPAGNWSKVAIGIRGEQPAYASSAGLASVGRRRCRRGRGQISLAKAAPVRPLGRSLAALALLWAVVGLLAVCLPGLAWTQWNRFVRPYDDVPPFSLTEFEVTPGQHRRCSTAANWKFAPRSSARRSSNWNWSWNRTTARSRRCRCFPSPTAFGGPSWPKWSSRPTIIVRAYRARSSKYHIGIITVPLIEGARLRIKPPDICQPRRL